VPPQQAVPSPLSVLYRDDCLLAINKPAGLLVHRSGIDRHEKLNAVRLINNQTGLFVYPVHRLDKATSGVLLFALNQDSARHLGHQFSSAGTTKFYRAIVRGYAPGEGVIDHAVRDRDSKTNKRQSAVSRFVTRQTIELPWPNSRYQTARYSDVQLQPVTGRRHQLRLHMKHISHPIIGDSSYGKSEHNRLFARHFDSNRLLLHAAQLCVTHPQTDVPLKIKAPLEDGAFERILAHRDWRATGDW